MLSKPGTTVPSVQSLKSQDPPPPLETSDARQFGGQSEKGSLRAIMH